MNKTKLSVFIDALFYRFIFFMLFLTVFNYFVKRPYSFILALTLSLAVSVFTTKSLFNKYKKVKRAEKDDKKYSEIMTDLNLLKDAELVNYFSKLLISQGKQTERKKSGLYCEKEKTYYFFKFGYGKLNKADIVKFFNRLEKTANAVITTESVDSETQRFASRFNGKIKLVSGREIYKIISDNSIYPPTNHLFYGENKKKKIDLKNFTDKKRAPKLIIYGTVFLLLSYIVPYKIFYVVVGSFFLIFALIVLIFSGSRLQNSEQESQVMNN